MQLRECGHDKCANTGIAQLASITLKLLGLAYNAPSSDAVVVEGVIAGQLVNPLHCGVVFVERQHKSLTAHRAHTVREIFGWHSSFSVIL